MCYGPFGHKQKDKSLEIKGDIKRQREAIKTGRLKTGLKEIYNGISSSKIRRHFRR